MARVPELGIWGAGMITPELQQECLASCIDEGITKLNFEFLEGRAAYDRLLYSDRLPRLNRGVSSIRPESYAKPNFA